ncbi:hypothetical protein [Pontibacter brevis]
METLTNRGVAKDHLQRYCDAIQDFNKAIIAAPSYPEACLSRCRPG